MGSRNTFYFPLLGILFLLVLASVASAVPLTVPLSLNETLSGSYSDSQFPILLLDGTINDSNGPTFDYSQNLYFGPAKVIFGSDNSDIDDPILYLDLENINYLWNLSVIFDTTVNFGNLDDYETLTLLNRTFFLDSSSTSSGDITLYTAVDEDVLTLNSPQFYSYNGTNYTVTIVGASDSPENIILEANGYRRSVEEGFSGRVGGLDIFVEDIFVTTIPSISATANVLFGVKEVVLEASGNVEINGERISGIQTGRVLTNGTVYELWFAFDPEDLNDDYEGYDEVEFIALEEGIVDPLFETLNLTFAGPVDVDDVDAKTEIQFEESGDALDVTFTDLFGNEVTFSVFQLDNSDNLDYYMANDGILPDGFNGSATVISKDQIFLLNETTVNGTHITYTFEVQSFTVDNGDNKTTIRLNNDASSKEYETGDEFENTGVTILSINEAAETFVLSQPSDSVIYSQNGRSYVSLGQIDRTNDKVNITFSENSTYSNSQSILGLSVDATDDEIDVEVLTSSGFFSGTTDDNDNEQYLSSFGTYIDAEVDEFDYVNFYVPLDTQNNITYNFTFTSNSFAYFPDSNIIIDPLPINGSNSSGGSGGFSGGFNSSDAVSVSIELLLNSTFDPVILTSNNLSTILQDKSIFDDDGDVFNYNQQVTLGDPRLTFGTDNADIEDPIVYLDLEAATNYLWNYTVTAVGNAIDFTNLDFSESFFMMGRTFAVDPTSENLGTITLYDKPKTFIELNSPVSYTANLGFYDFEIIGANANDDSIILDINGVQNIIEEGENKTFVLPGPNVNVRVDDLFVTNIPTFSASASLYVEDRYIGILELNEKSSEIVFKDYVVELIGGGTECTASSSQSISLSINGSNYTFTEGQFQNVSGIMLGIENIFIADIPSYSVAANVGIHNNATAYIYANDTNLTNTFYMNENETVISSFGNITLFNSTDSECISFGADSVILDVNGDRKSFTEQSSSTLGELNIYVPDIFITNIPVLSASANMLIDVSEVKLHADGSVEINEETVSGLETSRTATGSGVSSLSIAFDPDELNNDVIGFDETEYLLEDGVIFDPLFSTLLFKFNESPELDDNFKSEVSFDVSGEDLELTFTDFRGNEVSFDVYSVDNSYNILHPYVEEGDRGYNGSTSHAIEDQIFILNEMNGSNIISYVYEVQSFDLDVVNTTTIRKLNDGTDFEYAVGDEIGNSGVTITSINVAGGYFTLSDSTNSTVYFEDGSSVLLGAVYSFNATSFADIYFNESGSSSTIRIGLSGTEDRVFMNVQSFGFLSGFTDDNDNRYFLSEKGTFVDYEVDEREYVDIFLPLIGFNANSTFVIEEFLPNSTIEYLPDTAPTTGPVAIPSSGSSGGGGGSSSGPISTSWGSSTPFSVQAGISGPLFNSVLGRSVLESDLFSFTTKPYNVSLVFGNVTVDMDSNRNFVIEGTDNFYTTVIDFESPQNATTGFTVDAFDKLLNITICDADVLCVITNSDVGFVSVNVTDYFNDPFGAVPATVVSDYENGSTMLFEINGIRKEMSEGEIKDFGGKYIYYQQYLSGSTDTAVLLYDVLNATMNITSGDITGQNRYIYDGYEVAINGTIDNISQLNLTRALGLSYNYFNNYNYGNILDEDEFFETFYFSIDMIGYGDWDVYMLQFNGSSLNASETVANIVYADNRIHIQEGSTEYYINVSSTGVTFEGNFGFNVTNNNLTHAMTGRGIFVESTGPYVALYVPPRAQTFNPSFYVNYKSKRDSTASSYTVSAAHPQYVFENQSFIMNFSFTSDVDSNANIEIIEVNSADDEWFTIDLDTNENRSELTKSGYISFSVQGLASDDTYANVTINGEFYQLFEDNYIIIDNVLFILSDVDYDNDQVDFTYYETYNVLESYNLFFTANEAKVIPVNISGKETGFYEYYFSADQQLFSSTNYYREFVDVERYEADPVLEYFSYDRYTIIGREFNFSGYSQNEGFLGVDNVTQQLYSISAETQEYIPDSGSEEILYKGKTYEIGFRNDGTSYYVIIDNVTFVSNESRFFYNENNSVILDLRRYTYTSPEIAFMYVYFYDVELINSSIGNLGSVTNSSTRDLFVNFTVTNLSAGENEFMFVHNYGVAKGDLVKLSTFVAEEGSELDVWGQTSERFYVVGENITVDIDIDNDGILNATNVNVSVYLVNDSWKLSSQNQVYFESFEGNANEVYIVSLDKYYNVSLSVDASQFEINGTVFNITGDYWDVHLYDGFLIDVNYNNYSWGSYFYVEFYELALLNRTEVPIIVTDDEYEVENFIVSNITFPAGRYGLAIFANDSLDVRLSNNLVYRPYYWSSGIKIIEDNPVISSVYESNNVTYDDTIGAKDNFTYNLYIKNDGNVDANDVSTTVFIINYTSQVEDNPQGGYDVLEPYGYHLLHQGQTVEHYFNNTQFIGNYNVTFMNFSGQISDIYSCDDRVIINVANDTYTNNISLCKDSLNYNGSNLFGFFPAGFQNISSGLLWMPDFSVVNTSLENISSLTTEIVNTTISFDSIGAFTVVGWVNDTFSGFEGGVSTMQQYTIYSTYMNVTKITTENTYYQGDIVTILVNITNIYSDNVTINLTDRAVIGLSLLNTSLTGFNSSVNGSDTMYANVEIPQGGSTEVYFTYEVESYVKPTYRDTVIKQYITDSEIDFSNTYGFASVNVVPDLTELPTIDIVSSTPSTRFNYTMSEIDNRTFSVTVDANNTDLAQYYWYDNGKLVSRNQSFTLFGNSSLTGSNAGAHKIKVVVSNGYQTETVEWNMVIYKYKDIDDDKIPQNYDGFSGVCTGGNFQGCSDNCPLLYNPFQQDANSNGIGDVCEGDRDQDGINDSMDIVIGNVSHMTTNLNLTLVINNTEFNETFNETLNDTIIVFRENNKTFVEVNYTFQNTTLDLTEVVIQKTDNSTEAGGIVVAGINNSAKKTVYIDRNIGEDFVCIRDEVLDSIADLPSLNCSSAGEVALECDGTQFGNYTCEIVNNNTQFKVSGLTHSGVRESTYAQTVVTPTSSGSSSSSGSSGGGSSFFPSVAKELLVDAVGVTETFILNTDYAVTVNSRVHSFSLIDILDQSIILLIDDNQIVVSQGAEVDLDADGRSDIIIRIVSRNSNSATIEMIAVPESALQNFDSQFPIEDSDNSVQESDSVYFQEQEFLSETTTDLTSDSNFTLLYLVAGVVILGMIVGGFFLVKSKKPSYVLAAEKEIALNKYISKAKELGYPKAKVIADLTKKGWPKEYIEKLIKKIK